MRKLFDLENPVFQLISRLMDLAVLGLICIVCCVPVVTVGPAVTALFKAVYDLTIERGSGIVRTYFRAFRDNFKQAAIVGIAMLVVFAALVCDFMLLRLYFAGTAYQALLVLIVILAFLVLSLTAYLFPLISRYNNTLSEHLRNAAILMILHFPKTICTVFVHLLPLLMFFLRPEFMLQTLVVWLFLAPGLIAQADSYILMPVFKKLEKKEDGETAEDHEEEETP